MLVLILLMRQTMGDVELGVFGLFDGVRAGGGVGLRSEQTSKSNLCSLVEAKEA